MIRCTMFFVHTVSLPPSMHQQHTEYGGSCMKNYQLLTDSHVEFEDNIRNIFVTVGFVLPWLLVNNMN